MRASPESSAPARRAGDRPAGCLPQRLKPLSHAHGVSSLLASRGGDALGQVEQPGPLYTCSNTATAARNSAVGARDDVARSMLSAAFASSPWTRPMAILTPCSRAARWSAWNSGSASQRRSFFSPIPTAPAAAAILGCSSSAAIAYSRLRALPSAGHGRSWSLAMRAEGSPIIPRRTASARGPRGSR